MVDRFQVAAIVDRLIYAWEDTFDREDAVALNSLVPPALRRRGWSDWLQISGSATFSGGSVKGESPGHGEVRIPDDNRHFEFDTAGRRVLRAGQWKIRPMGSALEIEQVMAGDLDEARTARIRYNAGEPIYMDILVPRTINLGFLAISFRTFQAWKRPAKGKSPNLDK